VRKLVITFFGLGYLPIAPGTWGSLGAAVVFAAVWYGMIPLANARLQAFHAVLLLGVGLTSAFSITWGPWACTHFGRSDPKPFVLDEVAGQWLSLFWLPVVSPARMWLILLVQFFLFRVFDVIKPPPARQFEKFKDGYGIVADDLMSAIYVNIIGQLIFRCLF
jgi:phosphatidylglycerophosphatase A